MGTTQITAEPGKHGVQTTREFGAPRELLFRAFTEPDLLVQWLGPRKYVMEIDRYEVRDGGMWRYIHRDDNGNEFGFHGVFHGTPSPERVVQTFEFEGYPGHVSLDTATFEENDGKTLLRINSVFQSVEDRDGMISSGMEEGMNEGFDRLDELLEKLVANG
jgi:uncharacterized protein YndB with AHSA1/START domain